MSLIYGVLIGLGLLGAFGIGYVQGRKDRPEDRPDEIPGPIHF